MTNSAREPIPRIALCSAIIASLLMISGCAVPGYPYSSVPQGDYPPPPGYDQQEGYVVAAAPPPIVITPVYYPVFGYGYWYRGGYWPYRNGCNFYNGRYYQGGSAPYPRGAAISQYQARPATAYPPKPAAAPQGRPPTGTAHNYPLKPVVPGQLHQGPPPPRNAPNQTQPTKQRPAKTPPEKKPPLPNGVPS
jgi:hypothetical protein